MKNLEFFKNLSIGQYVDVTSVVHALSPAAKFLWLLAIVMPVSLSRSTLVVAIVASSVLGFSILSRVKPSYLLRGFLPVLPLVLIVALLQILFTWSSDTSAALFSIGPVSLTMRELSSVLGMAFRFLAMMLALGLFTSVITEGDTARGVEDLFMPLARIGFPAHELALAIAVAFRFIPILAGELETVVKAQASRGADFGGTRGGPIRKLRAYFPLIVPISIRALERAEALAEAMEARCYSSVGRTRYVASKGGSGDRAAKILAMLFALSAFIASAVLSW
jgi:energy-coupling factor transport system permease protein